MRILFMGTPEFAVPSLTALVQAGHEIVGVVSQPDKQRGRGKTVSFPPVKEKAAALGLSVLQPQTLRDERVLAALRSLTPDVIVVIAYGKILPAGLLTLAPHGCLNVHASLLPKYRGAAPIQYTVMNGETEAGISIMKLDEGMDTGDILAQARLPLDGKETTGTLFNTLAVLGKDTLLTVLDDLDTYERQAVKQDPEKATYTKKIDKSAARINWRDGAVSIERLLRTLDPQPGAYTFFDGKRLKIWSADVVPGKNVPAGTILEVTKKVFTVQTGKDALCIKEVQPESRKRMSSAQFLQSHRLTAGTVLTEGCGVDRRRENENERS